MSCQHPTHGHRVVPLRLPPTQTAILRDELKSWIVGIEGDLDRYGDSLGADASTPELEALRRLLAALDSGEIALPDEEARVALVKAAEGYDEAADLARAVAVHDAHRALLDVLGGVGAGWWAMRAAPEAPATVAVCVDDGAVLDILCDRLVGDRHEILPVTGTEDALRLCRYHHPDLLVLDLAFPDGAGFDLLETIRSADSTDPQLDPDLPIIVLAGRGGSERARGLDLGADDHVQKPFAYDELRGRIAAVLRRRHSREDGPVGVGEILIDPARRRVMVEGREVHLARKEFTLLRVLASDPTRVFSRDELLRNVWGSEVPAGRTRTLASHASRLRRSSTPRAGDSS